MIPGNGLGALTALWLAHQRGETEIPRDPAPLPHHQRCPVCGSERWDGRSEHPRGGVRFAKPCFGPREAT